jgi:alkylation response protein AidB-like acyl-CoA dehydrogenase
MDLNFSAEDTTFRDEVRHFVAEHLPADIRRKVINAQHLGREDYLRWQRILHAHGWGASSWPAEHGGPGWSAVQRHLFDEECFAGGAPGQISFRLKMVAPVIIASARTEQAQIPAAHRRRHRLVVPGLSGRARVPTPSVVAHARQARRRPLLVNGQKTWTTLAQHADWIFCLVRTDPDARKRGRSFLLIDSCTRPASRCARSS